MEKELLENFIEIFEQAIVGIMKRFEELEQRIVKLENKKCGCNHSVVFGEKYEQNL